MNSDILVLTQAFYRDTLEKYLNSASNIIVGYTNLTLSSWVQHNIEITAQTEDFFRKYLEANPKQKRGFLGALKQMDDRSDSVYSQMRAANSRIIPEDGTLYDTILQRGTLRMELFNNSRFLSNFQGDPTALHNILKHLETLRRLGIPTCIDDTDFTPKSTTRDLLATQTLFLGNSSSLWEYVSSLAPPEDPLLASVRDGRLGWEIEKYEDDTEYRIKQRREHFLNMVRTSYFALYFSENKEKLFQESPRLAKNLNAYAQFAARAYSELQAMPTLSTFDPQKSKLIRRDLIKALRKGSNRNLQLNTQQLDTIVNLIVGADYGKQLTRPDGLLWTGLVSYTFADLYESSVEENIYRAADIAQKTKILDEQPRATLSATGDVFRVGKRSKNAHLKQYGIDNMVFYHAEDVSQHESDGGYIIIVTYKDLPDSPIKIHLGPDYKLSLVVGSSKFTLEAHISHKNALRELLLRHIFAIRAHRDTDSKNYKAQRGELTNSSRRVIRQFGPVLTAIQHGHTRNMAYLKQQLLMYPKFTLKQIRNAELADPEGRKYQIRSPREHSQTKDHRDVSLEQ